MRKLSVLAMIAAVLVTGTVFAAGLKVQPNAAFIVPGASAGAAAGPATTNNDDSCDIGVAPAATLLLPYFEVDLGIAGTGRTTLFSITNVSALSQIAHVTVWTDWSYPVLDFNIFLTGYDVQPINLYDVIARGLIGGTTGTSTSAPNARTSSGATTNPNSGTQPFSTASGANNFGNPNFLSSVGNQCAPGRLPGQLPGPLATDVRAVLSTGRATGVGISCPLGSGAEAQVGGNHGGNVAIGYVTIDVAATCSTSLPTDAGYFTGEILFDNVLIGDYQDVNQSATAGNYAGGNPLVHIRAVPEGGPAGSTIPTNLPFTFYDRYTQTALARTVDRRQPLPSAFAARWISGTTAAFDTQYKIWREGFTGSGASCGSYILNSDIGVAEIVRFDERENATIVGGNIIVSPPPPGQPGLPETSRTAVTSSLFPQISTTDAGGWMYLNLSNGGTSSGAPYSSSRPGFGANSPPGRDVSQNWVIVSMFAEGRYGVDFDAAWLGNGCSAPLPGTASGSSTTAFQRVGPAGGVLVCPTGTTTNGTATQCTGTNVTP